MSCAVASLAILPIESRVLAFRAGEGASSSSFWCERWRTVDSVEKAHVDEEEFDFLYESYNFV